MSRQDLGDHFPPVNHSFEIEILVAQELPGFNYESTFDDFLGSGDARPWACPAHEKEPYETILAEVKELLLKHNRSVAGCEDRPACQPHAAHAACEHLRFLETIPLAEVTDQVWHVEPSVTTYAKRHSPRMYEWFGVRLRSPATLTRSLVEKETGSSTEWILDVLSKGLVIHLNSTCRFNVRVRPLCVPISLVNAKKMVTLVWVLEKELLERLCPNSYGRLHPHVRTLEAHSRVASLVWHGSGEQSPREDPLNSAVMKLHLPTLHNKELLARLQFLWQMQSLEGLASALLATTGQATSFAIWPTGGPLGTPIFEFRYALWHPFGQLDASKHWIELSMKLAKLCMKDSRIFKKDVSSLDNTIHGFSESNASPTLRRKTLLSTLGLEKWSESWEVIINQYKDGQRLAAQSLDKQKLLLHEALKADDETKATE